MTSRGIRYPKGLRLVAAALVQTVLAAGCFQASDSVLPWERDNDTQIYDPNADISSDTQDTATTVFDTGTDTLDTGTSAPDTETITELKVVDCQSLETAVDNLLVIELYADDWIDQREYDSITQETVFRHTAALTDTSLGLVNPLDRVRIVLAFMDPVLVHEDIPSSASFYILGRGDGVRMADGESPVVDAIGNMGGFLVDHIDVKGDASSAFNDVYLRLETGGLDAGESLECLAVEFTVPAEWSVTDPFSSGEIPIDRVLIGTLKLGMHEQDPHPLSPTPL